MIYDDANSNRQTVCLYLEYYLFYELGTSNHLDLVMLDISPIFRQIAFLRELSNPHSLSDQNLYPFCPLSISVPLFIAILLLNIPLCVGHVR